MTTYHEHEEDEKEKYWLEVTLNMYLVRGPECAQATRQRAQATPASNEAISQCPG